MITAQLFFLSFKQRTSHVVHLEHRAILQNRAHASCIQKTCDSDDGEDLRQLPLAGIAPERARGPERGGGVDPGGLRGFAHLGLHVWVDLRGRGRQLSACHGSPPPPRALPLWRQAGRQPIRFLLLLPLSERCGLTLRRKKKKNTKKTRSPSQWRRAKAKGKRVAPCRITGSSDTLRRASSGLPLIELSSIPGDGDGRFPPLRLRDSRVVTM